jgi:hypothetical protein
MNQLDPEKNSTIKRYALLILAMIILLGLSGCMKDSKSMSDREKKANLAEKLLHEKYGKNFTVYSEGGSYGTLTDDTFTVLAYEKNAPTLRFRADIAKDGSYMLDDFISTKVSDKIETSVRKDLQQANINIALKVGAGVTGIDSKNADMSVDEFIQKVPKAAFVITVVMEKKILSFEEANNLVALLSNSIQKFPNLKGSVDIYVGSKSMLENFNRYNRENPGGDSGMYETVKNAKNGLYYMEGGRLKLTTEQLISLFN